MVRAGNAVTVNGVSYGSASDAARELAKTIESASAIAKVINEAAGKKVITAQTINAALDKNGKVAARHANYKAIRLAKTGRYTANEVSERAKISKAILHKLLSELKIHCPTKEDLAKQNRVVAPVAVKKTTTPKKKAKQIAKTEEVAVVATETQNPEIVVTPEAPKAE